MDYASIRYADIWALGLSGQAFSTSARALHQSSCDKTGVASRACFQSKLSWNSNFILDMNIHTPTHWHMNTLISFCAALTGERVKVYEQNLININDIVFFLPEDCHFVILN